MATAITPAEMIGRLERNGISPASNAGRNVLAGEKVFSDQAGVWETSPALAPEDVNDFLAGHFISARPAAGEPQREPSREQAGSARDLGDMMADALGLPPDPQEATRSKSPPATASAPRATASTRDLGDLMADALGLPPDPAGAA